MENAGMAVVSLVPLLNVRDVARSLEFYTNILGFTVLSRAETDGRLTWARIGSGAVELMLNASDATAADEARPAQRVGNTSFSDVVLYFEVADVNALHARLKGFGVSASIPFDTQNGREMRARDYDGYEIAFTSPLEAA